MTYFRYKERYSGNLPHLQPPEATLFVTFRLANSLPNFLVAEWLEEKARFDGRRSTPEQWSTFQRRWFTRFEAELHANPKGPKWLAEDGVASIVSEALHHRDGKVYRLDAFCIMPNHVHVVFAPLMSERLAPYLAERDHRNSKGERVKPVLNNAPPAFWPASASDGDSVTSGASTNSSRHLDAVLSVIMQSLKGYTARKCNLALGRNGSFWQHESFDRAIRDEEEFDRAIRYVLNNPVKAGLVSHWKDWKWTYCRPDVEQTVSLLHRL